MLALREKLFGPDHPAVGAALSQLMWINSHLGHLDQDSELLGRLLHIFECASEQEQDCIVVSLGSYANWLRHNGSYAEAAGVECRVLAITRKYAAHFEDQPDPEPWRWNRQKDAIICPRSSGEREVETLCSVKNQQAASLESKPWRRPYPQGGRSGSSIPTVCVIAGDLRRGVVQFVDRSAEQVPAVHLDDSYRRERLPVNLLQARCDCLGAFTYERLDKEDVFYSAWT